LAPYVPDLYRRGVTRGDLFAALVCGLVALQPSQRPQSPKTLSRYCPSPHRQLLLTTRPPRAPRPPQGKTQESCSCASQDDVTGPWPCTTERSHPSTARTSYFYQSRTGSRRLVEGSALRCLMEPMRSRPGWDAATHGRTTDDDERRTTNDGQEALIFPGADASAPGWWRWGCNPARSGPSKPSARLTLQQMRERPAQPLRIHRAVRSASSRK